MPKLAPLIVVPLLAAGLLAAPALTSQATGLADPVTVAATRSTAVSALTLLDRLPVRAHRAVRTYRRHEFRLWIDADGDGENTRAEVLVRASTRRVTESSHHTVLTGRWVSPYDGKVVTRASKLQIDHLVPLENAWISGAASWTAQRREAYANDLGDPRALVAVTAEQNERKGDDDPSRYLPPKRSDRCRYVESWIAVKTRWSLSVTAAERTVLRADLRTYCRSVRIARVRKPDLAALTGARSSATPSASPTDSTSTTPTAPASAVPTDTASASPTASASAGDQGVVHPGSFCSPAGATGHTSAGTAMVCGPASDGRDRWHSA